jgi:predicted DNA-binding protein YlxM (UPF0122 family)
VLGLKVEKKRSWEIANRIKLYEEAIMDSYKHLNKVKEELEARIQLGEKIDLDKELKPIRNHIDKLQKEKKAYEQKEWIEAKP